MGRLSTTECTYSPTYLCFFHEYCFHPLQEDLLRGPPIRRSFHSHWALCTEDDVASYFFWVS